MSEPTPAQPDAPPTCPRHPGAVSYVRCQRCDRPTCPACQVPAPVGIWCVDCAKAAEKQAKASRPGVYRRRSGTPIVTISIIAANVLFYVYGYGTGFDVWISSFGFLPAVSDQEPLRWITSSFVHAGPLHLGINMYMLYQFGSELERALGRRRVALLYGTSILAGTLVIDILGSDGGIYYGSSGGVFGLLAATAILLARRRLPWRQLAVFGALWIAAGLIVVGVSWQGHLGGALGGIGAFLAFEWWDRRRAQQRRASQPPAS